MSRVPIAIAIFCLASHALIAADWTSPCDATINEDKIGARLVCIARCAYGANGIAATDVGVRGEMSGAKQALCYGSGYCGMGEFVKPYSASTTYSITGTFEAQQMGVVFTTKTVTGSCTTDPPGYPSSGGGGTCFNQTSVCEPSESCPLILDLNADGIHTTSLDDPVHFWIDLNGRNETTAWTNPATEEAFLWIDLNHDHTAQVTELFGSRMVAPDGKYHPHGFDALAKYDQQPFGGDGDGRITPKDRVWSQLRLWVDRNHDAISRPDEISVPASHGIIALNLPFSEGELYDEQGNELYLVGSYVVRTHGNQIEQRLMADVEFRYVAN